MRTKGYGQSALLLLDVIDLLSDLKITYAVIGAFAASIYGAVRASLDADAIISLAGGDTATGDLVKRLKKMKLKITHNLGDYSDPIREVIKILDKYGNQVDLLIGLRGFDPDAFKRSKTVKYFNYAVNIVSLEDFIAMKIFAGSPKDIGDAATALRQSHDKIDFFLLKQLTKNYGSHATRHLESLLKTKHT
jgi:hypothetical protein